MFDKIKILELKTDCDPYKSTIHHVDEQNNITHLFNHWDIVEQDQFVIDNYNKRNLQLLLFI